MRDDLDIPMPAMGPAAGNTGYRVPRQREGMDPNTKKLAMIAAGIGGTLVVLLGAWSLTGHRRTGVPVVEADARPVREKPANAGGMQVAGKDEAILSGKAEGQAALAPPAEAPKPEALKAQERAAQAAAAAQAAPAAATPPAPAQPVAAASTAQAAPPAVAPAATPARPPAPAVAARPAAPPAPMPAAAVAMAPAVPKPATPAPAPAPVAQAKPAAKPAGGVQVQLAAVASEQAAMQEWQRLEKKAPALFGGHKPIVTRTQHDGRTFWRLRTSGFADAAAAKGFCEQARGKGLSCMAF